MYHWITEQFTALQKTQNIKISEHSKAFRHALQQSAQGTCGRSGLMIDPTILVSTQPTWLQIRFNNKPGYALFENKPYHIRFAVNQPIVTPLTFKENLSSEALINLYQLFPFEPEPLKTSIDEELSTLTAALDQRKTHKLCLNSSLLRAYFSDSTLNDAPLIDFSDIVLISTKDEKKPQNIHEFIHVFLSQNPLFADLPIIVENSGTYALYGNTNGNQWRFTELDPNLIKQLRLHIQFRDTAHLLKYESEHVPLYEHIIEKQAHTHFSTQPQQVIQLKKILNGLFYFEQALKSFEELKLISLAVGMDGLKMGLNYKFGLKLSTGKFNTVYEHAHAALMSFSHLDQYSTQSFQEEILSFVYALNQFQQYSESNPHPSPIAPEHQNNWAFQFGHAAGFMTRYIYDPNGQFDFHVLSQLSADFPKHIDTITTLLNTHMSATPQYAPNINAQQLKALQKEATKLLNTLKNTQATSSFALNPLYQIYQIINYAFLIRQVIILLDSTVTQIGFLNHAGQKSIRTYLQILKYQLFPRIFALTDKIEIELMFEPGSVSHPLMQKIIEYYAVLIQQTEHIANFSFIGPELLTVEDQQFLNKRRALLCDFMNNSKKNILKIKLAKTAADDFFSNVPGDQAERRALYAMLEPHLKQICPEAHNHIINAIQDANVPVLFPGQGLVKNRLSAYFTTLIETEHLRLKQSGAVIKAIVDYKELKFLPYHARVGYDIALLAIKGIKNPQDLSMSQEYPILIQQKINADTKYMVYGNTDGTKWALTPIEEQFIPQSITKQFNRLKPHQSKQNLNELFLLRYHNKHDAFYQELNLNKAHTYYQSQFDCMESDCLTPTHDGIKSLKPWATHIDWLRKQILPQKTNLQIPEKSTQPIIYLDQRNTQFRDLDTLTADQAFMLHVWYQDKIKQYKQARILLDRFKTLLDQYFAHNDQIVFVPQFKLHQEYKRLYHRLQPYLIGMRNFPEFDQKMVAALSLYPDKHPYPKLTVEEFHAFVDPVSLNTDKERVQFWQKRSKHVLAYAKKALLAEHCQTPLSLMPIQPDNPRAEFIFQNKKISQTITKFIVSLKQWIPLLKTQIQTELQAQTQGTPYPDIYDRNHALAQPPFVLLFKRIFNALYHIEQIAKQMESLKVAKNTTIRDANINSLIALWQNHGQYIQNIIPQLYSDPIIAAVSKDFQQQYEAVIHIILQLLQPHAADVTHVRPMNTTVKSSGLWYTLNSFYMTPPHLLALTGQNDPNMGHTIFLQTQYQETIQHPVAKRLTLIQQDNQYSIYSNGTGHQWALRKIPLELIQNLKIDFTASSLNYDKKYQPLYDYLIKEEYHTTDVDDLQTAAKKATSNIEYIIENSNSYLKLFLSSWMIYRLNSEIRQKLQTFAQTTQLVAMSHLNTMYSDYFTPILLEADRWEHCLGLISGTISRPIQQIIDEWYQGFIFPLKLKYHEKETLVCEHDSIAKRLDAETTRLNQAATQLKSVVSDMTLLQVFIVDLKKYHTLMNSQSWIKTTPQLPTELKGVYTTTIVPLLITHQQQCNALNNTPDWINSIAQELSPAQSKDIEEQVNAYMAYLTGIKATHQLAYYNSLDKKQYLTALKAHDEQGSRSQYRRSYGKQLFNAYLDHLPRRKLKLSNKLIHQEYHRELRQHFIQQQQVLLGGVEAQTDMDAYLTSKIKHLEENFEKQFLSNYQRLDKIQTAVEQFQNYLQRDKKILPCIKQSKLECLNAMHAIFEDTEHAEAKNITTINTRLNILIDMINHSETTLLAPQTATYTHCLDWLLDCVISLFTAIGLYTPERQQRYIDLVRVSRTKEIQAQWLPFFTTPQKPQRSVIATPGGPGLPRPPFS